MRFDFCSQHLLQCQLPLKGTLTLLGLLTKLKTILTLTGTHLISSRCEEPSLLHPLPAFPRADGSLDVLRLPLM